MNKVNLGDYLTEIKNYPDNTFDVAVVDPPYNIGKDFGNDSDKMEMPEYLDLCRKWVEETYRVLKPGGSMYIYGFSEILAHIFVNIPYENKRWLVWHYTNKAVPSLRDWQRSHESIINVWKGDKKTFNLDDVREDYTDTFLKNSAGKKRKGTKGRFNTKDEETVYTAHKNGALPRDVFKIPALAGGAGLKERWFYCNDCGEAFHPMEKKNHGEHDTFTHPTQKPSKLTEKLIKSCMNKNGKTSVLIPFAGSGSECVVAQSMDCDFVGFDLNNDYVKLSNSWLDKTKYL